MSTAAATVAKTRLEELISFFGINADVIVEATEEGIELQVPAADAGYLIGYHGETLRAIQYMLNVIVRQEVDYRGYLTVDIAGYKQARAEALTENAQTLAAKVAADGEDHAMRPMNAAERRIVHMALADHTAVETESRGEGPGRHLVIKKR